MKRDIILAGVGGQGILSIATVIGQAAIGEGMYIKQAEVHGMSQRGGDVQSNLRISTDPIASDLIARGGADIIISMEPMEALRYLPYLSKEGWIVTNTVPFVNIPNYPDESAVLNELKGMKNVIMVDIDALARSAGNPRGANIVLLGACAHLLGIASGKMTEGIRSIFASKGDAVVEANISAFEAGRKAAADGKN